jgi:Yeast cell wall synthesis protein KRE9/KNH1
MISVAAAGGTVTNYSNRFTLTGMTGTFSQAVKDGLLTVSGTTGPATVNNVAAAGGANVEAGVWGTPYNLQTGLTKYASMQPVPPTAITATNTSPLWPTSSVVLASTYLPIPSVVTTVTQPQTFSVSSHANTVSLVDATIDI